MVDLSDYSRKNFNEGGRKNHDRNMWDEMWRWLVGNRNVEMVSGE
jgi:hypothetical protein